jgi:hypothetical protein
MRNALIAVVLVALVVIGVPLFMNYQNTGDIYAGDNGAILAVGNYWYYFFASFATGTSSEAPTGGRFG